MVFSYGEPDMTFDLTLMQTVAFSPTLAADEMVKKLRAEQRPVRHMGFGQAPFPAPARMVEALEASAGEKSYLPVAGLPELRDVVRHHQARHLGTDPEAFDVLIAPGSKLVLYAAQMAIAGDLLLPVPSWVSYAPQAKMLGQRTIPLQTLLGDDGMVITGEMLETAISGARQNGLNPTKILLNYPNNPTGLTMPEPVLEEIAEICMRENIVIIADEIYGRLSFDGKYRSVSRYAPDHTIVTTGLSKHLSLGGWRLGLGTVPKRMQGLFEALVGIASETWSCVAAPVQIASIEAYRGHEDIEQYVTDSTTIHAVIARYAARRLKSFGLDVPMPQGGFYLWPGFQSAGRDEYSKFPADSPALASLLVEQHGLVTLPGTAFGETPENLRLRLSVCDYDGADAMNVLANKRGKLTEADIGDFAPNVIAAINSLESFVRNEG